MTRVTWLDGEYVPAEEAVVPITAHTLHYGLGVFEGIRCYDLEGGGAAIFRLEDHLKRLAASAKICDLKLPYSTDEMAAVCVELVRRNGGEPCYIRPLVFAGSSQIGLDPLDDPARVAVIIWKLGRYLGEEGIGKGIRVKTSAFPRAQPPVLLPAAKIVGQYVPMVLAKRDARRQGFDEALLLDCDGYVAEGSSENVFVVRDGELLTPLPGNIVEGFTRDAVIHLARDADMRVREARIGREVLWAADEVLITSTGAEVTPIRELDNREIGSVCPGPVTALLQREFFGVVQGQNDAYEHWLTRI